jgi:predicted acyltransferase
MILVNNPGSWSHIYPPLKHADWHGCTPTDLVFPFFLFIVGVAIPFAQSARLKRLAPGRSRAALVPGIVRRTIILFALGLLLTSIPTRLNPGNGILDPANLRILGVLQRIALCYLPAALLGLYFGWRAHVAVAIALMTIYSILMLAVPVPGHGAGDLSLEGNLAAYVDATLLGKHCYQNPPAHPHFWEPEGLLSTLPAIATTLLGLLAGLWLRTQRDGIEKAAGLLVLGVLCAAAGYVLDGILMPINKGLWTPSYVMFTAGLALLALGTCYWLIDVKQYRAWSWPFVIFGMNAIAIFVLSGIVGRLLTIRVDGNGSAQALKSIVYGRVFEPLGMSAANTSLLYAIAFVMMLFAVAWVMHRKRIYLKV